jgi:hypothetical protein
MLSAACGQILGLDDIDYEPGDGGKPSGPSDATTGDALGLPDGADASRGDAPLGDDAPDAADALPPPVTIASPPTTWGAALGMAVDDTRVYWVTADGYVLSAPKGGGPTTTIATGQSEPLDVALLGTTLYWSVVPPGTGPQCMVETASTAGGGADAAVTCICSAAVTTVRMTLGAGSVVFLAKGTGASVNNEYVGFSSAGGFTNVQTQGPSSAITATTTQGFLGNGNGFHIDEVGFPGLTFGPAECTTSCGGTTILDMALDAEEQNILWVTQGGGVHTIPIHVSGGTGAQLVVLPATPQRMARDANYIYVTAGMSSVYAVPIAQAPDAGVFLTLSSDETSPFGIAVDDTSVYWGNADGTIRRTSVPPTP